jgi:Spy/CpxP family protein refolding chaperone
MNVRSSISKLTLALSVFALIPLLGYGQPQDQPGRFERFLDLTPDQKAKLEELRKSAGEERQVHFDKMRKLREDMREAMKNPEANEAKINGLIDEMSGLRAERMKRGLARTREMRKILTPEQREKLAKRRGRRAGRLEARSFRDRRGWERPGWRHRPSQDFGRRRPRMDRQPGRW